MDENWGLPRPKAPAADQIYPSGTPVERFSAANGGFLNFEATPKTRGQRIFITTVTELGRVMGVSEHQAEVCVESNVMLLPLQLAVLKKTKAKSSVIQNSADLSCVWAIGIPDRFMLVKRILGNKI